jgi:hypothetical protein
MKEVCLTLIQVKSNIAPFLPKMCRFPLHLIREFTILDCYFQTVVFAIVNSIGANMLGI